MKTQREELLDSAIAMAEKGFEHQWSEERFNDLVEYMDVKPEAVDGLKFLINEYKLPERLANLRFLYTLCHSSFEKLRKELDEEDAHIAMQDSHKPHPLGTVKEIAKRSGLSIKEVRRLKASGELVNKLNEMGLVS